MYQVCVVWFISTLPFLICLVQCAAKTTDTALTPILINDEELAPGGSLKIGYLKVRLVQGGELIVRFRKAVSMWLLHDVVLGIFWFYLAVMMYDLTDDEDDSEWRTIFLSMLSWHIIFAVLHQMYLKELWSCVRIEQTPNQQTPCCGPTSADKWWVICQLGGLAAMYVAFIWRMRLPNLTTMGCSEQSLALFITGVCACYFGKTMTRETLQGHQSVSTAKTTIPLIRPLYPLNF